MPADTMMTPQTRLVAALHRHGPIYCRRKNTCAAQEKLLVQEYDESRLNKSQELLPFWSHVGLCTVWLSAVSTYFHCKYLNKADADHEVQR